MSKEAKKKVGISPFQFINGLSMRFNLSLLISLCILASAASALYIFQSRSRDLYNAEVENNFSMVSDTLVSQIVSDVSVEDYDVVRSKLIKALGFNQQVVDLFIVLKEDKKIFFDLNGHREGSSFSVWLKGWLMLKSAPAKVLENRESKKIWLAKNAPKLEKTIQKQYEKLLDPGNDKKLKKEVAEYKKIYILDMQDKDIVYFKTPMVLKTGLGFGLTYGEENIGTLWLGIRHEHYLRNERIRSLVAFAASLTQNVASAVSEGDYVRVRDMMGNMVGDRKNIEYAELLHADGTILFYSARGMKREEAQKREGEKQMSHLGRVALLVMSGRPLKIQETMYKNRAVLDIAVPVENEGRRVGVVRIGYSIEDFLTSQERTRIFLIWLTVFYFISGLLIAFLLSTRIAHPIRRLAEAAHQIGSGDLDTQVEVLSGGRETRELGHAFNAMMAGLKERDLVKDTFSRYVTKQVADEILADPNRIQPGGVKREVTILFADIRGFTTFSEKYSPEVVISNLNEYLSRMVDVIFKYEGTLDKFIGDAIMAVFGSPLPKEDDPLRAVKTAYEMHLEVLKLNQKWLAEGKEPIRIGIGVNTGEVIAGNIGDVRRMEYTVIGDSVNLASRIEGLTKDYGCTIIISESTYEKVKDHVQVKELELVTVKGKSKSVAIYELIKVLD